MIELSSDQSNAIEQILDWYKAYQRKEDVPQVLTLGGYAGTGKTTVMSFLRKELHPDDRVAFMAFTGKATAVLDKKLSKDWNVVDNISTIHSFMYRPILKNHEIVGWEHKDMCDKDGWYSWEEMVNLAPYADLIIVDEASMLPDDLFEDLLKYGRPILAVGDHGQLPPVKSQFNLMVNPKIKLEKIHRQAEDNPIIVLAHYARVGDPINYGVYGDHQVVKIRRHEVDGSRAEQIIADNDMDTLVLTGTNRERTKINKRVLAYKRKDESTITEDDMKCPRIGDKVICLRNNRKVGIYNGMIAVIENIYTPFKHPDYNFGLLVNTNGDCRIRLDVAKVFFLNETKRVKDGYEWYKAGEQFDYAYALTCHKAQGSEAKKVVVFGTGFGDEEIRRRWLYTAITRAQEELWLIS